MNAVKGPAARVAVTLGKAVLICFKLARNAYRIIRRWPLGNYLVFPLIAWQCILKVNIRMALITAVYKLLAGA
jgi:hypothetical protein